MSGVGVKHFHSSMGTISSSMSGPGKNIKQGLTNIGMNAVRSFFGSNGGGAKSVNIDDIKKDLTESMQSNNKYTKFSEFTTQNHLNKFNEDNAVSTILNKVDSNRKTTDGFSFSDGVISAFNLYQSGQTGTAVSIQQTGIESPGEGKDTIHVATLVSQTRQSLFNDSVQVSQYGFVENVPMLNNASGMYDDVTDCSISKLVELSSAGKMGWNTYRVADFLFCKEVGKLPNNHMITLRKFPAPIGDYIGPEASRGAEDNRYRTFAPLGKLVGYFGGEDNKLEDICKYNYHASFKEQTAEIQEINSQQKDTGPLDMLANFMSARNNLLTAQGFSGNNGFLRKFLKFESIESVTRGSQDPAYDYTLLSNYDKHKIYEPKGRVWDTHLYEGRLIFNQEFSVKFSYKLRAYDNINGKSAFLDLMGNVLRVTYIKGNFWGGEQKIVGPQGNAGVYRIGHAFIDRCFEGIGGIFATIENNGFDGLGDLVQLVSGWVSKGINDIVNAAEDTIETMQNKSKVQGSGVEKVVSGGISLLKEMNHKYHWTDAMKGLLKNQMGRPALYAFNSLLSGDPVAFWHIQIGNPRNPILSMGNLILTDAMVEHKGPLGIDDFPTELTVTCSFKHATGRDAVGIQKMYAAGQSLYIPSVYESGWELSHTPGNNDVDRKVVGQTS